MKLSTDNNRYTTTITSSADFGIQNEDLSHIMGILRSQIYSDKLLAVIREYSTNARDANIQAGNNKAIDVKLPSFTNQELSFRDYGAGLTDDEVCNLYVKYGASTKRDSNDYTGCLGIGCKAAFAYGDQFTIKSITETRITTWLARIDESKKGTISLISENENKYRGVETGVEVSIHIKKQDIDDCISKACNFFKYWNPEELRINATIKHLDIHTETDQWIILNEKGNNNYGYNRQHGVAKVLMGGIAYPIDTKQSLDAQESSYLLNCKNVILKAPLGSLEIAANRESLEYTDKTKASLNVLALNMRKDLVQLLSENIKAQPTRLKASIESKLFTEPLGSNISAQITKDAEWRGMPLLTEIQFEHETTCYYRKKSWAAQDYKNHKENGAIRINLSANNYLVVWDSDNIAQSNATRRIRTLQKAGGWDKNAKYYVIRKENLHLVKPELTPADYTDLTNITPLKAERTIIDKSDGTTTKAVKISVCQIKESNLKSGRLSEEAEPIANKDGLFIYVPLDRFDWQGKVDALDNLHEIKHALQYLGESDTIIHGVKKHYLKKLDNNWIQLDTHLKNLWSAWQKQNKYEAKALQDVITETDQCEQWHAPEVLYNVKDKEIRYIASIMNMKNHSHIGVNGEQARHMRRTASTMRWLGIFTGNTDFNKRLKHINQKYPLLQHMQSTWQTQNYHTLIARELNKYIKYINS